MAQSEVVSMLEEFRELLKVQTQQSQASKSCAQGVIKHYLIGQLCRQFQIYFTHYHFQLVSLTLG